MAFLNLLDTWSTKTIVPGVTDNVFRNSPLLLKMKKECLKKAPGFQWQENFIYGFLPGGFYSKGETFDISQPQTMTGGTVTPRYAFVDVTVFKEDISLELKGPQQIYDYVDEKMQEAALNMSGRLAKALFRHGQNLAGDDRSKAPNGIAEAISDGVTASWDGNIFTNYVTIPRNGIVGAALNSPIATGPGANVAGAITTPILELSFNRASIGAEMPTAGITTNRCVSLIKNGLSPSQRFENTQEADFGFKALNFNGTPIYQDNYCPGTQGENDALGNNLATAGEVFFWLNIPKFRFYLAPAESGLGFGFTGFKPAQNNTALAGQYLYGGTVTCTAPRLQYQLYAITG